MTSPVVAGSGLGYELLWTTPQQVGTNAVAHALGRVFVASGTSLAELDMQTGAPLNQIAIDTNRFSAITSVAAFGSLVAISLRSTDPTARGAVQLYNASSTSPALNLSAEMAVGVGPDMLTFTRDGARILVANEGEPVCTADGQYVDPEGSISVIDTASHLVQPVTFEAFNGRAPELIRNGVRIFGPGATVAQDVEPEHIAVGAFGHVAWVTLQENNAIAIVDLVRNPPAVAAIVPLGVKDHGLPENALDVSDKDGPGGTALPGNIQPHPNLYGMYLPDGIDTGIINGATYLFTANEGDARDYSPCFSEEKRASELSLALASFPPDQVAALQRLRVTTTLGAQGGTFTHLYSFGARSFAIWNPRGEMVFESGKLIETVLATEFPEYLRDDRSDDKGPEPEDLVFGRVASHPFLFVGLERANGVMAFDVRQPTHPTFAAFLPNPPDAAFPAGENPERLDFVPAQASVTSRPLLLVTNEVSGRLRAFELHD